MELDSIRKRMGRELLELFSDVGNDVVSVADLYDAAERRYGSLLEQQPDPARPSQQKWQHDLRWEIQSAVNDGRIIKRRDLGRSFYAIAPDTTTPARRAIPTSWPWDAILTVPSSHDISPWKSFDELYVPGRGRPRHLGPGSHLWLRHQGRLVWRAEIVSIVSRESRRSNMDGTDHGRGWSIVVAAGENADVADTELGFSGTRWGQGLRYLDATAMKLRGASLGQPLRPVLRFTDIERLSPNPIVAHTRQAIAMWNRIELQLVHDWVRWCAENGRRVRQPTIRTDEGTTLRADGFEDTTGLLIEAKGSASREHVRMGIGQVLDYSSLLRPIVRYRALLLPRDPAPSIEQLMRNLGIGLIVPTGENFRERLGEPNSPIVGW